MCSLGSAIFGSLVATTEEMKFNEVVGEEITSIDCCIVEDVEHAWLRSAASLVETKLLLQECQLVIVLSEVIELGRGLDIAAERLHPEMLAPTHASMWDAADIFDAPARASTSKRPSQVGEIGATLDDGKNHHQLPQLPHLPVLEEPCFISISALPTLISAEILSSAPAASCEGLSVGVLAADVTFASLVVARELLLQFGRFRGLPVPVITNGNGGLSDESVPQLSFQAVCRLISPSGGRMPEARDVLYLDWHYTQSVNDCSAPGCMGLRRVMELEARTVRQQAAREQQLVDLHLSSVAAVLDMGVECSEEKQEAIAEECLCLENGMSASLPIPQHVRLRGERDCDTVEEPVRTVQGLAEPEATSGAVNLKPTVNPLQGVGQKMSVLKMSDELSFFKSCHASAAVAASGQSMIEQPGRTTGGKAQWLTGAAKEAGMATAMRGGGSTPVPHDPKAAEPSANPEPGKPNSGRVFHDVQPTEEQLAIVEAARREYSTIAWRVKHKCAFPLRQFSLSPDDARMLQEYVEVVREQRTSGAEKAGSCTVAAGGGAGMHGRSNEADISLESDLILLSLLQQTAQQCWHYGMCVAHLALEYRWEAMQQQQSSAASVGGGNAGVQASAMSSSAALHSLRQQLLLQYDRVQAGDAVDHPKLPLLTSIITAHKAAAESQPSTAPSGQAGQASSQRPILLVTESMAFIPLYSVLADAGVRPVAVDRCGSLLVEGRLPASHACAVTHMVTQALETSSANCVMVSSR